MQGQDKRIGSVLLGRYEIISLIQKGGMGTVYLGKHRELDKKVAIKIFHPHLSESKEMMTRFINEARGIAKLQHRNIVNVFDIGSDEDGVPFFVMEYLIGESLRERLKRVESLPLDVATDIMVQILSGLRVAHFRGIIHRDLKPGNIFLVKEEDGSEVVKILDFGVAKFRETGVDKQGEITTDGSLLGTPSYMSPEQASGKKNVVDQRSDIYSCGLILYRCLTGINIFKGDTPLETLQNILNLEPPPPSFFNSSIPKEADEIILKAINKDKEKRYPDCESFILELKKLYPIAGVAPGEIVAKILNKEIKKALTGEYTPVTPRTSPGNRIEATFPTISHIGKKTQGGRNLVWIAIVIVAVISIALAGSVAYYKLSGSRIAGKGSKGQEATVEKKILPVEEKEKQTVKIEITGLIPGALVYVNGNRMDSNPLELPKSDVPVSLMITYNGKMVLEKMLVPDRDEKINVNIQEEEASIKQAEKILTKVKKKEKKEKIKEESVQTEPQSQQEKGTEEKKTKIFKDLGNE